MGNAVSQVKAERKHAVLEINRLRECEVFEVEMIEVMTMGTDCFPESEDCFLRGEHCFLKHDIRDMLTVMCYMS